MREAENRLRTPAPDAFVDITDVDCPVTFIKVQIALDKLETGGVLEVKVNGGRPCERVPRTLQCEGHELLGLADNGDGTFTLLVEKKEPLKLD